MESTFAYSCDIYYNFTTYWYVNLVMHLCSSFFLPATPEPRCSEPRSASHLDEDTELLATFTTTFRYIVFGHGLDIADMYTLVKSIWKYSSELCLAWQYDMSSGDSVSVYSEQSLGFIKDASNTSSAVYSRLPLLQCLAGRGSDVKVFFSWELETL